MNHSQESASQAQPSSFLCTTCEASFYDKHEQRMHMKEPWHVYNIKRKIASLPPISLAAFQTKVDVHESSKSASASDAEDQEEESSSSDIHDEELISPFQCLFCNEDFEGDNVDEDEEEVEECLLLNIEHMRTVHGMNIPEKEKVTNMESFLGYLATEVREWHECLYCGATKPTTQSIQAHMRDKRHCMLNLDREPELREFWDGLPSSDDEEAAEGEEKAIGVSSTERRFASGKIIGSRHTGPSAKKMASRKRRKEAIATAAATQKALPSSSNPSSDTEPASSTNLPPPPQAASSTSNSRALAKREAMGIIGISEQQRHALVLAEKKAQRSEDIAKRARDWVNARAANTQKHDQMDTTKRGIRGKQNHKLLPR